MTIPLEIVHRDEVASDVPVADHSDALENHRDNGKRIDDGADRPNEGGKNAAATTGGSNGNASGNATSGKRAKNKKRREGQQEFTHSWMAGALKGHTGPVLDMNFSSNGKFLASCAEDCDLVPEEETKLGDVNSGEGGTYGSTTNTRRKAVQDSSASSSTAGSGPPSPNPTVSGKPAIEKLSKVRASEVPSTKEAGEGSTLSRRQRKNRTRAPREQQRRDRDDDNDDDSPLADSVVGPTSTRHRHHRQSQHHKEGNSRHYHAENPRTTDCGARSNQANDRRSNLQRVGVQSSSSEQSLAKAKPRSNQTNRPASGSTNKKYPTSTSSVAVNEVPKSLLDHVQYRPNELSIERIGLMPLSLAAIEELLRRYILTPKECSDHGYPVEWNDFPQLVVISHNHHPSGQRFRKNNHSLDANAQEFVPGTNNNNNSETDSGNGSGGSHDNSDLEPECSSDSEKSSSSSLSNYADKQRRGSKSNSEYIERPCARCHKSFYVHRENGLYKNEDKCTYHWGKLKMSYDRRGREWECCQGHIDAQGCTGGRTHVWTGVAPGFNGPFDNYARTRPSHVKMGYSGVYALDCEMCFTRRGLECARVTLVDMNGRVVYDELVKPDAEVIDHNTRFSGITAKDLARATKHLRDVQADLMSFVNEETILIGHGLENDLRALRLLHKTVIDTCVVYPHYRGHPYRTSLKNLARFVLNREIQVDQHNSVEDARIAAELMLRKVGMDLSGYA